MVQVLSSAKTAGVKVQHQNIKPEKNSVHQQKNYFASSDPHHDISKQLVDTTFV
jgi:hypothetical protein